MDNRRDGDLPDDIVWEILTRLPIIAVFKCRLICKRWHDFLSTQLFVDMHDKNGRTNAVIIAEENNNMKLLEVEAFADTPRIRRIGRISGIPTAPKIPRNYESLVSCNGFLLLKEEKPSHVLQYLLLNPLIFPRKEVKIVAPRGYNVCGIFFHPNVKEYCILWRTSIGRRAAREPFKLLTLGSQPSWREIPSPASVSRCWMRLGHSVTVHDVVYWLTWNHDSPSLRITAFDVKMENFFFVPNPHHAMIYLSSMKLLKMEDHLCLVECYPNLRFFTIIIWMLKDYVNPVWTKIHMIESEVPKNMKFLKPLAFVDEALVFYWAKRSLGPHTLHAWNLKYGTISSFSCDHTLPVISQVYSHLPSLVSLMNCESSIVMPGTYIDADV